MIINKFNEFYNMIINKNEMIDGDKFENLCKEIPDLIYSKPEQLTTNINNEYVLSHNSDGCILPKDKHIRPMRTAKPRSCDFNWDNVPTKLKKLFAQNADVRDKCIIPIPIGLERDRWFPHLHKKDTIIDITNKIINTKKKLLYLNVNVNNNINSRPILYNLFKSNDWCTAELKRNGMNFINYTAMIRQHAFVLCPDGNGMDTHRTWETLYLGSYPIVERHYFTEEFSKELPILVVDNWNEITNNFLLSKYYEFTNKQWNWDMLKFSYWKSKIEGEMK